jgi:DNA ligase 1
MQRFTQLFLELDETNRTNDKVAALERYFQDAPPEDAVWGLTFLTGNRQGRAIASTKLRNWAAEETGLPVWLVDECYHATGDSAEVIALLLEQTAHAEAATAASDGQLLPHPGGGWEGVLPLHRLVAERILPLSTLDEAGQRALVVDTWHRLTTPERFVWHKLITGGFRVGVSRTLVIRALARVAGISDAVMAHRLTGHWTPTAQFYLQLLQPEGGQGDHSQPYPFCLAYQVDGSPDSLGPVADWQIEWKWDGIRAQVIHRGGETMVWTRGEEMVTDVYPEIAAVGAALPTGTVLDGEILAWEGDRPLPFQTLQRRLGRKTVNAKLLREAPVHLIAYDLLEWGGEDWRGRPLHERRAQLERVIAELKANAPNLAVQPSPVLAVASWEEAAEQRERSRELNAEGFMLKRLDSAYGVGRKKGDWWKWKIDPYTVDAVMIYAQRGSGKRASLYTDYTFAVWHEGELTPFTKAYSGLTDAEIREVDAFVRRHTTERFGPVRSVTPELVFELAFEGIQASNRHKSGIALRFPRILRWRKDKKPEDADTLAYLQDLLKQAIA